MDKKTPLEHLCAALRARLEYDKYLSLYMLEQGSAHGATDPPLVTEEELSETERVLGFSLPPFLWQIHPSIVEALSRRLGVYVFSEERPNGFVTLGEDSTGLASIELDIRTGKVYLVEYPDSHRVQLFFGADSLQEWFERWIENSDFYVAYPRLQLRSDEVERTNVATEAEVWHGLYCVE